MPNGVMSATAAAGGAVPKTAAGQRTEKLSERFLTLLVAQMKNQTPTNPMDSSQVTSQIAQINMVSGINSLNSTLNSITQQIDTTQRLQAAALIGHKVLVPGNEISVGEDNDGNIVTTPFGMELSKPAKEVTLSIINNLGEVVYQSTYANQSAGIQSFVWDGKDMSDAPVDPEGHYTVRIKAVGPDGQPVNAQPLAMGLVSGVVTSENGPKLDLGPNGMATLDEVRQIIS